MWRETKTNEQTNTQKIPVIWIKTLAESLRLHVTFHSGSAKLATHHHGPQGEKHYPRISEEATDPQRG